MTFEDRDLALDEELKTVKARFKSLPVNIQQDYQERARAALPHSFHSDLDVILLNAMQMYLKESPRKGGA